METKTQAPVGENRLIEFVFNPGGIAGPARRIQQILLDRPIATGKNETMNRDQVIATLRAHEQELKDSGIVRLSLFGSVARGDAGQESDIDLLAAFDKSRRLSLLDVVGIERSTT